MYIVKNNNVMKYTKSPREILKASKGRGLHILINITPQDFAQYTCNDVLPNLDLKLKFKLATDYVYQYWDAYDPIVIEVVRGRDLTKKQFKEEYHKYRTYQREERELINESYN